MAVELDMRTVHEWLDAGGSPDDLRMWVDAWEVENPAWFLDEEDDEDNFIDYDEDGNMLDEEDD